MDDDKQVTEKKEVQLFLSDFLDSLKEDTPKAYNLEYEYAKTKKNKSWGLVISVLVAILLVWLIVFFISREITAQTRNVSVGIEAFDDLNLKNVLDKYTKLENSLNSALAEKMQLENLYKSKYDFLASALENNTYAINSLTINEAEKKRRIAALQSAFEAETAALRVSNAEKIAAINITITDLNEQMTAFDSRRLEEAQKSEAALDSARQVYDIEKKQIVEQYEATIAQLHTQLAQLQTETAASQRKNLDELTKNFNADLKALDPVVTDEKGSSILQAVNEYGVMPLPDYSAIMADLSGEPAVTSVLDAMQADYEHLNYAADIVLSLPQKNSIPQYIDAMRSISFKNAERLELLLKMSLQYIKNAEHDAEQAKTMLMQKEQAFDESEKKLLQVQSLLIEVKASIASIQKREAYFDYSFKSLLERNGDAGYIVDGRDVNAVAVYIDPLYASGFDGKKAYVFRKSDEYIGTILLKKNDIMTYGVVEKIEDGKTIESFDRIVFDLEQ